MALLHIKDPDAVITHPNRDTAAAKSTRALVVLLLVASAALIAVITWGSTGAAAGGIPLQILIGLLFAFFAYRVSQWRSGVLPIAAGFAIASGIFAAVSAPGWFDREGVGYKSPPLGESLLGILVIAYAILQILSLVVYIRAITQKWQVELEVPRAEYDRTAA